MRWEDQRESTNVEDRRGMGPARAGGMRIGLGGIVLVLLVSYFTGMNPLQLLNMLGGIQEMASPTVEEAPSSTNPPSDQLGRFASVVLADTEDTWRTLLPNMGKPYDDPRLVFFTGAVASACGTTSSAVGPFYCPADRKVYLDLSFFNEMSRRLGAPGDFAQAYVIAHEVGHHVQTILGIADKVQELKQRHPRSANQIQVRMELQADCLAGVWANLNHQLNNRLQPGDIEEGLNAAAAIGDDMIQKRTQGHVVPDAFTHGSSAQRVRWFKNGFENGKMQVCDTFNASDL